MCKQVSAMMMLGYTLNSRKCVSAERLRRKRVALMEKQGDILADISFSSIRKAVEANADVLRLHYSRGSYGIYKTQRSDAGVKFFDKDHLKRFYSPAYSPADYSTIESILAQ